MLKGTPCSDLLTKNLRFRRFVIVDLCICVIYQQLHAVRLRGQNHISWTGRDIYSHVCHLFHSIFSTFSTHNGSFRATDMNKVFISYQMSGSRPQVSSIIRPIP
jgi:hypothetical protein